MYVVYKASSQKNLRLRRILKITRVVEGDMSVVVDQLSRGLGKDR